MVRALGGLNRRCLLTPVVVLLALLVAASAGAKIAASSRGRVGTSHAAAAHDAIRALRADGHRGAELVLGLLSALPAGTRIAVGGPERPSTSGRITRSKDSVVDVLHRSAWLFYQDLAPFQQYAHPGRIALVDAATGRVTLTKTVEWPPLVDGALPAFLASRQAYDGSRFRVFYRPYVGRTAGAAAGARRAAVRTARATMRRVSAALNPGLGGTVAGLLAAQHACTVRFSDTVSGGYYAFGHVAQSRAALDWRFMQLGRLASGFKRSIYTPSSGLTPTGFVARTISQRGCKDVMLYLAGGGYGGQSAINIGIGTGKRGVVHQDVTLAELRGLMTSEHGVNFELVIDAAHASGFQSLSGLANVLLVATPGSPFTYLPEASENGRLVTNDVNPFHILQLTDRLAFGIDRIVNSSAEVSQMQSLASSDELPSALAYVLARGFALGGDVDFVTNSGVGLPPIVKFHGFTAGPPATPTVTADPDSYAATSSAVLTMPASAGVLANDSDSAHNVLAVDQVNGSGGTPPLHTTSAKGAAITMNADGSFTYDPTVSAALTALSNGQSTTDSFTYRATDAHGGTATATVTITVAGRAHRAPALSGIESSTLQYTAGTAAVPVTSGLAITAPDDTTLTGATVSVSSGLAASEDALRFSSQNGITGSYSSTTGVLTLSGTSSVANYQAALRSVTYSDSNGTNPTTGTRTISFQVNDGDSSNNLSNAVSRSAQVSPNPPPVASDDRATTNKNTAIDVSVLANDSDSDGDGIHVASVDTAGTKGLVSINPDGTIHYDPNGQFSGLQAGQSATDTFTYEASDGFHNSNSATVTVTVTGVNDPPVLSNIEASTIQYEAGTSAVPVTSTLTVSSPGTTTLVGATIAIGLGFAAGEDVLSFTNQNGITGSYDSSIGVLTLSGTASVADYQAALRSVTYSDSNGTNPATGPRSISFRVDDGASSNDLSNMVSRTVSVTSNSPPVAGDVGASTDKHTAIDVNVLAGASDPDGDPVTLTAVDTSGTLGSVSINPNGTVHYDPNGQFTGLTQGQSATDTFGYTVSDGFHTASGTVTVTVTGVNDPPVLANVETTPLGYRAQDPAVQITGTLTIRDDDDATMSGATASITAGFSSLTDMLSFTNQNGITDSYNATTGVLTLSGNASIADYQAALRSVEFFTSDGSASPPDRTVSFTVTDSVGATSTGPAQRTINVSQANKPPVLANIESSTLQYDAGTPAVPVTSTLTVSSPGTTTLVGATVAITNGLTSSEDALEFTNQNGITGSYNATTGVLRLAGTASVANYQAALRSVTYSDPNGTNPTTGPRTVAFEVDDGASSNNLSNVVSRTVSVAPNSPPVAGDVGASTDKHTAIDINVLASASDPDGDPVTLTGVNTTGTSGSVSINPNGTVHYDPGGEFTGLTQGQTATDTFGYTVSDGFHTDSGKVTVTITGVNDPPVVSNIEAALLSYRAQDPAVQITHTLTISDDDDATMAGATVSITSGFNAANDTLSFTSQNGITGGYNATTGVLTLSGNASIADYQAALRSVEFFTSDGSASPADQDRLVHRHRLGRGDQHRLTAADDQRQRGQPAAGRGQPQLHRGRQYPARGRDYPHRAGRDRQRKPAERRQRPRLG